VALRWPCLSLRRRGHDHHHDEAACIFAVGLEVKIALHHSSCPVFGDVVRLRSALWQNLGCVSLHLNFQVPELNEAACTSLPGV
jgi:hypothetical protein